MFMRALVVGVLVLTCAFGCGGQVERDGGGTGGSSGRNSGTGARGAGTDGGSDFETDLEACEKGQPRVSGEPCPWIANELCYSTKEEACACVCPPGTGSVCLSGFPSDFEPVDVSCF
jgi:hypothetical protein